VPSSTGLRDTLEVSVLTASSAMSAGLYCPARRQ
jgi:hypothetical protein